MKLSLVEKQFFELLKGGLWGASPDVALFSEKTNWESIKSLALNQAVAAVVFDGMQMLPKEKYPPKQIMMEWYKCVVLIEKSNERLNAVLAEVVGKLRAAEVEPVLLKGQGNAQYYPRPLHRQPGDIDLFCEGKFEEANEVLSKLPGSRELPYTTYHRSFIYKGIDIENHCMYADFYHPANKRKWEKVKREIALKGKEQAEIMGEKIYVPQPQMNVVYVFLHLFHHFLHEGVGLRQVCDWLLLCAAKSSEVDVDLFRKAINLLPARRGMTALGYVGARYLGWDASVIPLDCSSKQAQRDGETMLREILRSGNFGQGSAMMKGFEKGRHLNNLKVYAMALLRFKRIFSLCPGEIMAYPCHWLKAQFVKPKRPVQK